MKLTEEQRDFLKKLYGGERLSPANPKQDRTRQLCRKNGLAYMATSPRRWAITDKGIDALEGEE
ncbi:hypothetical protein [Allorhizobium ampelinum]|uniref:hypothetical protein n=1 Tax=Allorhizobium ampelinum TaxID=3025782 RepID=UPI000B403C1D|nr:hypothetical protein [Allorhizobium ampelinum]NTA27375.1 hypothetical protein [Allorhizobium ampelinum]OVE94430.1 hypothetical protein B7W85_12835 [Allorhizobium ampelinum]